MTSMQHTLDATPETIHWGFLDAALQPVLTIQSGDSISVISVSGAREDLPTDERFYILDRHRAILDRVRPELGPHILTGPVAINGAEPGDVLEVRIDDIELIQNWGYNYTKPLRGVLPARFPERSKFHIGIDRATRSGHCPWGTRLPLRPFFGIMAVAPRPAYGRVSSVEPREYGGNIDNRELIAGSRLYLPIFVPRALFSVGDGHGCQGDGEVNLTALETALRGHLTLILHKNRSLPLPRATTSDHFMTMAFDPDLDDAASAALNAMIDAITACSSLNEAQAYALCSLACSLRITQLVDGNKGVHAMLPRDVLSGVSETEFALGRPQ